MKSTQLLLAVAVCSLQVSLTDQTFGQDADQPRNQLRQWAVIADPELQAAGLSDLVTAELTSHGIPLVEREQIERIQTELVLARYFGADGTESRVRLGHLLKADALVLLGRQEHKGVSNVRLIISDCTVGARLHANHFELDADKLDELGSAVSEDVRATRDRFAGGVERLVTVTPLLSRNLTHEFDHLQNGYAAWLGQTLLQLPGVAVVEIEEARAIREELDLNGTEIADTWHPLFISGEFEMTRKLDVRVAIKLSIRNADNEIAKLEAEDLLVDATPEWLASHAGRKIAEQLKLSRAVSGKSPLRKEQFELLVERARTFAGFGAYPEAISLRAAALLLRRDVREELQLIENYSALRDARRREAEQIQLTGAGRITAETWQQRFDHDLSRYRGLLAHARRLLGMDVPVMDLIRVFRTATMRALPSMRYVAAPEEKYRDNVQAIREQFAWDAIARFAQISRVQYGRDTPVSAPGVTALDRNSPAAEHDAWVSEAAAYILGPRGIVPLRGSTTAWRDQDTFAALERLIVEYSVPEWPSGRLVAILLRQLGPPRPQARLMSGDLSEVQVQKFAERLRQRPEAVAQFYGRCTELGVQLTAATLPGAKVNSTIHKKSQQLVTWTQSWQKQHASATWGTHLSRMMLKRSVDRLDRLATSPRDRLRLTQRPPETTEAIDYFRIERLDVKSVWRHLVHCRDDVDVVWSFAHVMLLRAGQPQMLFRGDNPRDQVRQVAWDGEFIWVGARQSGVHIFDLQGQELIHIPRRDDADDSPRPLSLPLWEFDNMGAMPGHFEYGLEDHHLRLFAVSPGRCLVMGKLGRLHRFWLALIERQQDTGEWSVDVVHQATHIPDARQREPHEDDLLESCVPAWIAKLPPSDGKLVSRVVMGRRLPRPFRLPRTPLLIDLTLRTVTRYTGHGFQRGGSQFEIPLDANGQLIVTRGGGYVALPTDAQQPDQWGPPKTVSFVPDAMKMSPYQVSRHPPLLFDGVVHFPGSIWRRLFLHDGSVEDMNSLPFGSADLFEDYAVSGPFGLVGWNHGDHLYQIRVRPKDHKPTLTDRYRFVPEEHRDQHHQAVTRLREFGAVVTTRFGFCRFVTYHRSREPQWRTSVWVGEDWTGGDLGLRWLQDVYNVRELELVHAPVTDAAVPLITSLKHLQRLTFERTEVTDKGLSPLRSLHGLAELRLVGADDGSTFSNKAMPVVKQLSLERLMVYGPGFTNEMLDALTGSRLRQLCIVRTGIDGSRIEQLKRSQPRLQVFTYLRY